MTYTQAQIEDAKKRVTQFQKTNKRNPKTVKVGNNTLTWEQYQKLTTTPTTTNRYISKPYLQEKGWLKQDYDTSCALNSIQQSVYKLTGLKISEKTMYQLGYTGSNGTSHDGINQIIKWINRKYKQNLTIQWKNLSSYGSTPKTRWTNIGKQITKPNVAIFAHIGYVNGGTTCTGTSKYYGHYEVFDIVNTDTMYIRALNSLSGGYLQDRKIAVEECMISKISQPSICVITKE